MLGVADVKPVAEHDTDKSDASEIVPVTQPELDFKHSPSLSRLSLSRKSGTSSGCSYQGAASRHFITRRAILTPKGPVNFPRERNISPLQRHVSMHLDLLSVPKRYQGVRLKA
jgi:hypothetical protein